ncbi:MAG: M14 family metallopeptidase [Alphaproteobacteria bacterium]|nr:M14 family metallopeptidase [Alphaproteobacteria bacterium]
MTPTDFFSADYQEARRKFLDACRSADVRVDSFKNPHSGPDGGELYTDVAVSVPQNSNSILLLESGIHGVEGFAGSGIQTGLLREGIPTRITNGTGIVMIHAINPYGFAHLRRVNEDNVDLNRNFVDHTKPYPKNSDYEALADAIAPEGHSSFVRISSFARLMRYRAVHGKLALQSAIAGGQFTHPQGLFYGGTSETWSNKTVRTIIQKYLADARRIAFIDIHTGLGPYGYGELIHNYEIGSPAHERAAAWWGERLKSTATGESVSTDLTGTIKLAVSEMLPNTEVTGATLEFGTVPLTKVLRAMQDENWMHHYGDKDGVVGQQIQAKMRRVFYPDTDEWKTLVWQQGKQVVEQTLVALSA